MPRKCLRRPQETCPGVQESSLEYNLMSLRNDPPEVCVEDELTNSGKWLLSTFISYVLIRHPSMREIQESFASLKHIVSLELGC